MSSIKYNKSFNYVGLLTNCKRSENHGNGLILSHLGKLTSWVQELLYVHLTTAAKLMHLMNTENVRKARKLLFHPLILSDNLQ